MKRRRFDMAKKADFNAEEWSRVLEGPPLAAVAVITAQRGGTVRESISMAKAYAKAREESTGSELLDEIIASQPGAPDRSAKTPEEFRTMVDDHLRAAIAILESNATSADVAAYKEFTINLAERVAEAHKSGGFLGIGGERVSDNEREAIEHIAATLGVDAPAPPTS